MLSRLKKIGVLKNAANAPKVGEGVLAVYQYMLTNAVHDGAWTHEGALESGGHFYQKPLQMGDVGVSSIAQISSRLCAARDRQKELEASSGPGAHCRRQYLSFFHNCRADEGILSR